MKWKKLLSGILTGALLFTSVSPVSLAAETDDTGNGTASVPVAVAEYRFEDNLNNSMAENDAAAPITTGLNSYNGTPTYVEGRTEGSKAIKLGDFGLQLNKKNLGKNFTVSAWFKADGTFAENQTLMFLGYHNPEKWISIAGNKSGTDQLKVWTSEGTQGAEFYRWITLNNPTLKAGEWHCITLTQSDNDNTVKTYIDGELYNTSRGAYALDGENQDIYIAVNNWDAEFAGAVDDVKVYDQTLTDTEVYKYCYDVKISNQALTTYDFDDFAAKADDAATLSDGTRDISLVTVGNGQAPSLTTDSDRGQVLQTVRQGTGDNGLNNIGYAQLPSNPFEKMDTSNGLTLNFWANTQGAAGGNRCMIDFEIAPATTGRAGTVAFNQSMVYWNTTDQDGKFADYNVNGLGLGTENTWKMVTMTLTEDEIAFYSNGRKISHTITSGTEELATMLAELTGNGSILPDDGRTQIRLGASMANYWIGAGALLDDISFFGKALNASEVSQLYDETATSELATGIVVSSDDTTVDVDKTMQLTATLEPAGATGVSMVSWKSSDEKVATVDRNGLLTALAAGTTTITASIGGLVSNELTITVESIPNIDSLEEGYYLAVYTTTTPFYANKAYNDQEAQSVYLAVSKDGKTFDVLNSGGAVIFSKMGTQRLTDPKVFKENGTFTVIARDADKSQGYHEFTSTDGVKFYDESMTDKASQTSGVLTSSSFKLILDGENLLDTDTNLTLGNAVELTEKEYTYIVNKLGTVVNDGLEALEDKTIQTGDTLTEEDLAESYPTATATYTDGSTQDFNIDWSGALDDVDLSKAGTYTVTGKVVQTKYLNNLKELNGSTLPEDDPANDNPDFPDNYDPATGTVYYDSTKFVEGMADPMIYWDEQTGYYYMTGSYFPENGDEIDANDSCQQYDRVVLRRGRTLEELQDRSNQVTIWKAGNQGYENAQGQNVDRGYRYIWAPEIHRIGDKWVVHFTESHSSLFDIHCHALVLDGDLDPYETALTSATEASQWKDYQVRRGSNSGGSLTGAIDNSFCLDMTYFKDEVNGKSYVIWASNTYTNSRLYMATIDEDTPWVLTSDIVMITKPEYGWENVGIPVNEGATVLQKDGNIYLCYSAASTGSEYAIGMLTAKAGTDLLAEGAWTKSPYPVLSSRDVDGEEGPGHNSFTVDKDGNVIFVYHARPTSHDYRKCGWDGTKSTYNSEPLNDPCRHARLKRVHWSTDGTPILKMTYENELLEENETISLTITVKEKEEPSEPSVTSITVKTAPEKTEYTVGEELDLSGIVIEAAYDDGTKKEIDIKDCTVTGFDNTKAGTQKVTVTYEDQTVTFEVTVSTKAVSDIFDDVDSEDWFNDYVQNVYDKEIMTGLTPTHFGPTDTLARAQFALMLYRMEGEPEVTTTTAAFPDAGESWYKDAVIWANQNKIITGYTDSGLFGPADPITREQMATIMYRYANYKKWDVTKSADLSTFPDASSVSAYAKDAMAWAVANEIIQGNNGRLDPQGSAVRAQAATIISRFIETYPVFE